LPRLSPTPKESLRHRRQARIRRAIQDEAFRLFREKGYDATTVEEIAAAADISPRTFFRYFPSKEGVVFWPSRAPDLAAFVAKRPQRELPVQAVAQGMIDGLAAFYAEDRELVLRSLRLAFDTAALRSRLFGQQVAVANVVAAILAKRQRRNASTLEVRAVAAAIAAAMFVALEAWQSGDGLDDVGGLMRRAFGSLISMRE
jgi:AcrR family transcriptional regulator